VVWQAARYNIGVMHGPDPLELRQIDRLAELVDRGPGKNDAALAEAHALLAALDTGKGYRSEKIGFAHAAFAIWFSTRKWQKWGVDPGVYRSIVLTHVATVRFAVEQLVRQ
jgi:hypothetical protein